MIFQDRFKNFIDISAKLSFGSSIYITDLEKVIYVASESFSNIENKEISVELKALESVFANDYNNKGVILSDNKIIPIYNNQSVEIKYITQIILPIVIDGKFFGTLINTNDSNYYDNVNLRYAKTTLEFVEIFIRDSIKKRNKL
ncbi:MAG: hypothetical protein K0R72_957 [Clostridia bacterium]|nr:hypothetical protein [Clostridia bacterium]